MSDRSAIPVTFIIRRACPVPPAQVLAAFAFAMDGVTYSYDTEYFDIVPDQRTGLG